MITWLICCQKQLRFSLFLQYFDDLPSFHFTFFKLLLNDHALTSWMGQREIRPTADPNGEVIVIEM